MLFYPTISTSTFKQWLYHDKENQRMNLFAFLAMIVSFTWLKIFYPFPNFMPPDSYNYLEAAFNNQFINIWSIGYSKFLQLIGYFNHSHFVLVIVQYLLLQASLLYLLFTLRYLLTPNKWLFRLLFATSILNPLLPHIANFVSSDCLFITLSIIWYTQLLWIIYQPNLGLLFIHAIVLLLAFMVRYNALYFPLISAFIIILSNVSKGKKCLGIVTILVLILSFIGRTQYEYYKKTGTIQYTAFGGWQMAANALYGYAYANSNDFENLPNKFKDLHQLVNKHMDSLRRIPTFLRPDYKKIGVYYMWDFKSPLRIYMDQKWKSESDTPFFKQWASVAPLYASYGRYMIAKYPWQFMQYYILPNLKRYFIPPAFFMGSYNLGNKTVDPIAVVWFGWKHNELVTFKADKEISIAKIFTILSSIINIVFILGFVAFLIIPTFKICSQTNKKLIKCTFAIWVSNFIFSILSAPIELRYQLFSLLISTIWGMVFISYTLINLTASKEYIDKKNTVKSSLEM